MSTVKPAIVEEFLEQCRLADNSGITVLRHPGDFSMGWRWFERICERTGPEPLRRLG